MPLGVDPAELEAQLKWQCQYMPVLRRLSTRNVVLADQLKTSARIVEAKTRATLPQSLCQNELLAERQLLCGA